jgi:hypothetical protein
MGKIAIIYGGLLVLLGVGVYGSLIISAAEKPSPTALIPAFFGAVILLAGVAALRESLRMHAMHFVALLALLGVVAPLGRLGMKLAKGEGVSALPLASLILMATLCVGVLFSCIKSFKDARRRQREAQQGV